MDTKKKKLLINKETFTAFIVDKVKEHSQKLGMPPLKAFMDLTGKYYKFSVNHSKEPLTMTLEQYRCNFCKFILSELTYFEFISDDYFNLLIGYYNFQIEKCALDEAFLSELQSAIKNWLQRTEGIIKILDKQSVEESFKVFDILDILKLNHPDLNESFIYSYIFNYGYIEGKRAERAKRAKKCSTCCD